MTNNGTHLLGKVNAVYLLSLNSHKSSIMREQHLGLRALQT